MHRSHRYLLSSSSTPYIYIYSGNIMHLYSHEVFPDVSHVYFTCIFIESCSATTKYNSRFGCLRRTNSDSCKYNLYFEKKFFCWIYTCIQKDVYMQERNEYIFALQRYLNNDVLVLINVECK